MMWDTHWKGSASMLVNRAKLETCLMTRIEFSSTSPGPITIPILLHWRWPILHDLIMHRHQPYPGYVTLIISRTPNCWIKSNSEHDKFPVID